MCDFSAISGWLIAASVALVLAAGLITAAIAANAGFFTAGGAPALMIAASISGGVAIVALNSAANLVAEFQACVGSTYGAGVCTQQFSDFITTLRGISAAIVVQTACCIALAIPSAIPYLGAIAMSGVLGALIVQTGLIGVLTAYFEALRSCVNTAAGSQLIPQGLLILFVIVLIVMVILTLYCVIKTLPLVTAALKKRR